MLINMAAAAIGRSVRVVVNVVGGSGLNYNASNAGQDATLDLIFDTDGNEYVRKNGGAAVQRNTASCWIRPTSFAPGLYEIRFTNKSGSSNFGGTPPGGGLLVEDTWYPFSDGDMTLDVYDDDDGVGNENVTFTIEIRLGSSGPAINTGVYTIQANKQL